MIYSKVRTYLKARIAAVDSDFKEHKDAFNDDNIAKTGFNKAYHILYSVPSISKSDYLIDSEIEVIVKFFFRGYRDTQAALDDSMDLVNSVALDCGSLENLSAFRVTDDFPIQYCNPTGQVPEPLENNDNSIIVTLNLNMSVLQTLC